MRRLAAAALLGVVVLGSSAARATCVPGRIEVDPRTGTVVVELPKCEPPPQQ